MARKHWQKPQPLYPSFHGEEVNESKKDGDQVCSVPVISQNSLYLVTVSDSLNLAPFSKRAVVDFGDSLVVGFPSTRYLRLRNPRPSSITVHCKRYPASDEFTLTWLLTSQDDAENLTDPEHQALISPSSPAVNLVSTPSLEMGPNHECLLRIVWTPKPAPLSTALDENLTQKSLTLGLRHVLQFRLGGSILVEATLVASTIRELPTGGKKKLKKGISRGLGQRNLGDGFSTSKLVNSNEGMVLCQRIPRPPRLAPNIDPSETLFQTGHHSPDPVPLRLQSVADLSIAPSKRNRSSWILETENRKRSTRAPSLGLRILAAYIANKDKRLSQSLDQLDIETSLLEETGFQTPRRSVSTVNDFQHSPEHEPAAAFISPALLSPVVKRDSNILFNTKKTSILSASTSASANIFGWDASSGLSEANELGFTRWLNHLFTCGHATRSSISKSAYQEEDPRGAVLRLLRTPAFSAPGHRIEREIDSRKLLINKDLNFKADKGLQLRTCELFTSHYSPIWLSPCVDVLTKFVQAPEGQSKLPSKASSLTKRIHRYLFSDVSSFTTKSKTEKVNATEKQPRTRYDQVGLYTERYNQQVVKRCILLIWLLDQAKIKKALRSDPCLFNLSAPSKSSVAVCLILGRNYLTRETNLARNLSSLGANLTAVQSSLDEFDFTVTNLAVDLRDGLRLVKLADLLLVDSSAVFASHNGSLISLVRFPAISRLQKIHNVRLALSAFGKAIGHRQFFTAAGKPISERDIVDGHRAKTLSLLWFILLHFQVTALLNPPVLWNEISRLIDSIRINSTNKELVVDLHREANALLSNSSVGFGVKTQDPLVEMANNQRALFLWVRAVISAGAYDHVNIENLDQSFADGRVFCYLLHFYLPTLLPKRSVRVVTTQTAKHYSSIPLHLLLRNNVANLRLFQQRLSQLADVPSLFNTPVAFTTTVSTDIRRQCSASNITFLSPGIVLATLAFLASRIVCTDGGVSRLRRIVRDHAVRIIQAWWRQIRVTKVSGFRNIPTVPLIFKTPNASFEGHTPSTEVPAFESPLKADDVLIEFASTPDDRFTESALPGEVTSENKNGNIRGSVESIFDEWDNLQNLEMNAVSVLASFADRSTFECTTKTPKMNEAAICIQGAVRSWLKRRRVMQEKEIFVVEIQSQARAFLAKVSVHSRQKLLNHRRQLAASIIQNAWRTHLIRRKFLKIRSKAVLLQTFWRGILAQRALARKALEARSASIVQCWWRGHHQRQSFIQQRQAALVIQGWWRGILTARRQDLAIQIQAAVRAYLIRCAIRAKTRAIIVIQRNVRTWLANRHKVAAACTIQRWWRATRMHRTFIRSVKAIRLIQRWWRLLLQRRLADMIAKRQELFRPELEEEGTLLEKRNAAAVTIQSAWKFYRIRKKIEEQARNRQVHMEVTAAITIQRFWRRYRGREQIKELARNKPNQASIENSAALSIQRSWKAYRRRLAAKIQRAAITIQRNWRASCLQRWLYRRRRAAIILQAAWRGHRSRCSVAKLTGVHMATFRKRLTIATKQARDQPHNCLGARARRALANLLRYTSVASVLDALGHLDVATHLSREVCTWLLTVPSSETSCGHAEYLPHVLLRLLHLCNRSVADEEVALAAVAVMLNLVNNVDPTTLSDATVVRNIWWQCNERSFVETGSITIRAKNNSDTDSIDSKSIVEYLFICLHRLSRARIGTWSVRLFARIAALLSKLCMALPSDFEIPAKYVQQIETLLPSVRRLWSLTLARIPVRPEVTALIRKYKNIEGKRKFLLRRVNLELDLERLSSKPHIDPLVACELLLLSLHEHQHRQCHQQH